MLIGTLLSGLVVCGIFFAARTQAQSSDVSDIGRLITLHDRGVERVFVTDAMTVDGALEQAGVELDARDTVEPALDEPLVADEYNVNIYRARPLIIVDGAVRQKIITSAQTAEQIVRDADSTLHAEDQTELQRADDILADGAALQLVITRATPLTLDLYGKVMTVRTQARTITEFLQEKNIELGENDRVSASGTTAIAADMTIRVWREGTQTVTVDEVVAFEVEQVRDANREVGYSELRTPGVPGERSVTYEVMIQNGKEVSRTEIASVTTKEPAKQVEVVGTKPVTIPYTGGGTKSEWLAASIIPSESWGAADVIVSQESGWNPNAVNASSGACGLGQQLPCGKWAGQWNNPIDSLNGMHGYVIGRYGSWENAVAFKRANGWY